MLKAQACYVASMLVFGLTAAGFDLARRRIPNNTVLLGLTVAFAWHALAPAGAWAFDRQSPGAVGLWWSMASGFAMLLVFFPLWLLKVLGAGDVKLLAVVGAAFGASPEHWSHLPGVLLYIAMAGGFLVLGVLTISGRFGLLFRNLNLIAVSLLTRQQGVQGPVFDAKQDTVARLPYGAAIVAGSIAFVLSERFF